jgi:hypothetical protein
MSLRAFWCDRKCDAHLRSDQFSGVFFQILAWLAP